MTAPTVYLVAKSGPLSDNKWPLGEEPFVLGRDRSCDIRIPDPVVSRRHCEVTAVGTEIRLRDLGGVNPTIVNGLPVMACTLSVGDRIRIGRTAFLVTTEEEKQPATPAKLDSQSTLTLMESESRYLAERSADTTRKPTSEGGMDFGALFHVSRALSRASSVDELRTLLGDALANQFAPKKGWFLPYEGERETASTLCGRSARAAAPFDLMRRSIEERKGALTVRRPESSSGGEVESLLAAPVFMGDHRIGALALCGSDPAHPYERDDLDFLVALAHVMAPLFRAVERLEGLELENKRLRAADRTLTKMVGGSRALERVRQTIRTVAPSDQPVLIQGETGTGKELVASSVHKLSNRVKGLLVTVNCAAIPRELFESEFFGHEKGAFTGATHVKKGLFEQSHGGTLFLDEIGDLSIENQARILRAIETQRFRRVGGTEDLQVDFRVVAATNKDVHAELRKGNFREDLFHRLRGIEILVPPLRQRKSDIPHLADHFLESFCSRKGMPKRRFSPEAMEYLTGHSWPGNARELRNCVETAATLARSELIERQDVLAMGGATETVQEPVTLADMERQHILAALEYSDGKVIDAAKLLGISKSKLYNRLAEYNE